MAADLGPLREDMTVIRESSHRMEETIQRLCEEFEAYKVNTFFKELNHLFVCFVVCLFDLIWKMMEYIFCVTRR
jgi:hypothetical protein